MNFQKLLIPTLGLASALAAATPAIASDHWDNDDNDDWDDDKKYDDDHWDDDDRDGQGVDWNKNKNVRLRNLRFADRGDRLAVRGEIQGLKGKRPVRLVLEARGEVTAVCINPKGKIPPGKNPVDADEIKVRGREHIDGFNKGGLEFRVATDRPDRTIKGAPDCPNKQWTERILDVAFTRAQLSVVQDGKRLLELECYFDDETDDGKVARKQFHCEES